MDGQLNDALVGLADAADHATTSGELHRAALCALRAITGLDRLSLRVLDDAGVMRFTAWDGLSSDYRAAAEPHSPWTSSLTSLDPLVIEDVRAEQSPPAPASTSTSTRASTSPSPDTFARERIRSFACVPIVTRRRVIGVFTLYRETAGAFDGTTLAAALALGHQLGAAIGRHGSDTIQPRHQRMRFALDAAHMGTWEWEMATGRVHWSDNLEAIHGLPPGTFTGGFDSYEREIHPDDRARVLTSLQRAVSEDTLHDVEYRIVAPDGAIRWVHGKGHLERDAAGQPLCMSGVCMDITARRQAEIEIRSAMQQEADVRQRLTVLTEGSHRLLTALAAESVVEEVVALAQEVIRADGYAVWRRDGHQWHITAHRGLSDAFVASVLIDDPRLQFDRPMVAEDVFGIKSLQSRQELYAAEGIRSLVSIPLAVRGQPAGSIVFYYRAVHRPTDTEVRVATALGHLAAAAMSNAALYAEQQQLRRDAEDAEVRSGFLAEASALLSSLDYERNLRRLAELAVPLLGDWCAVDLLTGDGRIDRIAATHVDPDTRLLVLALHDRYPARMDDGAGIAHVLRTGEPDLQGDVDDSRLLSLARDDEHLRMLRDLSMQSVMTVPLSVGRRTCGTLTFGTGRGGRRFTGTDLAFASELGRRAAFAIENARLFNDAREANRLKDEFLATLSHELRTPLNVILGRTYMLQGSAPGEARDRAAVTIDRNARVLARLVEDLLDVSRISLGQVKLDLKPIDFTGVVDSVVASLEPAARAKGLQLKVNRPPTLPPLVADATRLEQVVWNLLTNAIKFTPDGGTVDVNVRHTAAELVLTVSDTGNGITGEFLPHVFDMFRQAEPANTRRYGGLGLGLSIVRRLVELHGGSVTADSEGTGRGATLEVSLPCVSNAPPTSSTSVVISG